MVRRFCHIASITAMAVAAGAPTPCGAQTAALEGIVVGSADGRHISGALIVLDTGERAKSDASGMYGFDDVIPGQRQVALVAPDCQVSFASIELLPGERRRLGFEIAYDEAQAIAQARKRVAEGLLVTAADIEAMHAASLTDVLRRVAPSMVGFPGAQPGSDEKVYGRGWVTAQGPRVPVVVVDGSLMGMPAPQVLGDISPADVAYMEILKGASGGWQYGTGGAGGVIRIQTKRGQLSDAPLLDPELCPLPEWR